MIFSCAGSDVFQLQFPRRIHQVKQLQLTHVTQLYFQNSYFSLKLVKHRNFMNQKPPLSFDEAQMHDSLKHSGFLIKNGNRDSLGAVYFELVGPLQVPFIFVGCREWAPCNQIPVQSQLESQNALFSIEFTRIQGVDYQSRACEGNLTHHVYGNSFLWLFEDLMCTNHHILLPLYRFQHELKSGTLLSRLVESRNGILAKEMFRFHVDNTTVKCLQFCQFVAVLMLAFSFKFDALLSSVWHLDCLFPTYACWQHFAISCCGISGFYVTQHLHPFRRTKCTLDTL